MNYSKSIARCSLAALLILASGCTHLRPLAIQPTALPAGPISTRHAALVTDQSLADYKFEIHVGGDTLVYPYGHALTNYAEQVANKFFQKVDVFPSLDQASAASADLILIPRVVKCDVRTPVWAWEQVNITLVTEWTAKDRASQNTVWLNTITADASEKGGTAFSHTKHERILNQKLFDDLSLKTYKAFQAATELK